jgi:hypothetical protein
MRRFATVLAVTAAVLVPAAPAFAHNEINPSTITVNKPTYLTLNAPNEGKADLVKVSITVPKGLPLGSLTRQPDGWTVEGDETTKTWSGGTVAPDEFAQFGFETDGAPQPGDFTVKVAETFSDGSTDGGDVVVSAAAPTAAAAAPKDDDGAATAALVVGIVAAVLALAGIGLAVSKGKSSAGAPGGAKESW